MTVPYTYLIGWSHKNTWYYGVQYAKNCNPDNLWKKYFTSSKYVKSFREQHGEPDIIQIRKIFNSVKKARLWEEKVIEKMNCVHSNNWLNRNVAGQDFYNDKPNSGSFYKGQKCSGIPFFSGQIPWNKGKKGVQIFTEERNKKVKESLKRKYEIIKPDGSKEIILGLGEYCKNNKWPYAWVCTTMTNNTKYKGHKINRIDTRPSGYVQ